MHLSTLHWHHLHGKPLSQGTLKSEPEDFRVDEKLSFELSGHGEHLYLHIEKTGLNTGLVAQKLAHHFKVKERDVAYAGRKDKHAITRQWFSIYLPDPKSELDKIAKFQLSGCTVKNYLRHNKKLRTGAIESNHFEIRLQNFAPHHEFESRLSKVIELGVPNYFGPQRFGNIGEDGIAGNIRLAQYLLRGEVIRKREKRSMAISALRSWLFNELVSRRIKENCFTTPMHGDVFTLTGSHSFFLQEHIDSETRSRLEKNDISISAPLWGKGALASALDAYQWESTNAMEFNELTSTLEDLGLRQERRAVRLLPMNLTWHVKDANLVLNFSLPSGCFATSVIRELVADSSD